MAVSCTQGGGAQEAGFHGGRKACKGVRWRGVTLKGTQLGRHLRGKGICKGSGGRVDVKTKAEGLSGHLSVNVKYESTGRSPRTELLERVITWVGHPYTTPGIGLGPCSVLSALSPLHAPSLEGRKGFEQERMGETSTVFLLPDFEFLSLSQA